jgi:dephospho-CoA kinase
LPGARIIAVADSIDAGPFTKELCLPDWPEILQKKLNSDIEIHYVYCSPSVRIERIRARGECRDLPKLKEWEVINNYYGKEDRPVFHHIFVDTTENS